MTENARPRPETTLGLVLAGGLSRRMGEDKAQVALAGIPMLRHVMTRLRPQVGAGAAISSNAGADALAAFGAPVLSDLDAGFPGPLAGLAAGLRFAREQGSITHVLSVSTDTPFLPRTLAQDLEAGLAEGASAAVAASRGQVHWVTGLWPVAMLDSIETALSRGERRVQRVLDQIDPGVVAFDDVKMAGAAVDPFFNVNTREDLADAEALLAARGVPVFGIVGWKGAGKTTLVCRLIEALTGRGLRVGSIKHSHHAERKTGADTNSAKHAAHGAVRVAFVSPAAWGIEPHVVDAPEPPLADIVAALGDVDVVIVEGMKRAEISKIEVRRGLPSAERPALAASDPRVIAIASDEAVEESVTPLFRRDDVAGLERVVLRELGV